MAKQMEGQKKGRPGRPREYDSRMLFLLTDVQREAVEKEAQERGESHGGVIRSLIDSHLLA